MSCGWLENISIWMPIRWLLSDPHPPEPLEDGLLLSCYPQFFVPAFVNPDGGEHPLGPFCKGYPVHLHGQAQQFFYFPLHLCPHGGDLVLQPLLLYYLHALGDKGTHTGALSTHWHDADLHNSHGNGSLLNIVPLGEWEKKRR